MNTLIDLNIWIENIRSLVVSDENIEIFNNFMRFSPEKFADKINIERDVFVKEFDKHKKFIHNKVILFKKIKELSKRKVDTSKFFYQGKMVSSHICFCIKEFKFKSIRFYPTIKYLYFQTEDELIVLPDENRRVIITQEEFYEFFIDNRERFINNILDNDK